MKYLLTFLEGFASFVSPCMLPLLPVYISYFAGDGEKKTRKTLINSIGFVLGFSIIFIALAIIANSIGNTIIAITKYAKYVFGIMIIVLGLNYTGAIRIGFLNKSINENKTINNLNLFKAMIFGMLFSICWTPCIGTFLSAALLLIANEHDLLSGLILITLYSVGLGIPFIISAVLIEELKNTFDFIKKHYNVIKIISGIVLIVMGVYVMIA